MYLTKSDREKTSDVLPIPDDPRSEKLVHFTQTNPSFFPFSSICIYSVQ